MEHFGLHYSAPKVGGEPVPGELSLVLQAELASRAGKQLGGRGLRWAHDEPAGPGATRHPPPPGRPPSLPGLLLQLLLLALGGLRGLGGWGGLKQLPAVAHARPPETSMCPAPLTLSAVLWRAWGSPG